MFYFLVTCPGPVSDRDANTVTVSGEITGDNFPATEVFITDNNGQSVFLATGKPPGVANPLVNLLDFGVQNRHISDVSTTINTDDHGNFLSVESNGQTISIKDWNNEFESRDPGFVDPMEGVNDAASELHEGYGDIGAVFNEARDEIVAAGNPVSRTIETVEAATEIGLEIAETGVSTVGGYTIGRGEAVVGIADWVIPGDGIPGVDLNLPEDRTGGQASNYVRWSEITIWQHTVLPDSFRYLASRLLVARFPSMHLADPHCCFTPKEPCKT